MKRRDFIKTGSAATMGILMGRSVRNQFDVVIKKGMIYDGIGSDGIRSDIGIKGISRI